MEIADLADDVVNQLFRHADQHGIDSIPPRFRSLIVIYDALGLISNGGFQYWFECRQNMDELIQTLKLYRFDAEAEICTSLSGSFPGGSVPCNTVAIQAFVDGMSSAHKQAWESFADAWQQGITWGTLDQRTYDDLCDAKAWLGSLGSSIPKSGK